MGEQGDKKRGYLSKGGRLKREHRRGWGALTSAARKNAEYDPARKIRRSKITEEEDIVILVWFYE
jgi:hypothetical protein